MGTENKRIAYNTLADKFSSNCGISCKKLVNGEQFNFKPGQKGSFVIENICPVSGDCMIESTLGTLTNVMFTAPHASHASEARRSLLSETGNRALSRQEIYTSSHQTLMDRCNINSTKKISNVEFLMTGRKFGGPISIVQNKTMKSNCPISEALNASGLALSSADNAATFDKRSKRPLLIGIVMMVIVLSGSGVWAYMKTKNGSLVS